MPGTYRNADPTSQVDRSGTLDAHDIKLIGQTPVIGETSAPIPSTTTSILPIALDLLDGLAGSITILGQVYQDSDPISDLRNRVTSVIDSITAEIRPAAVPVELIGVGAAASATAKEAGAAVPTTFAGPGVVAVTGQIAGWLAASMDRIEAIAAVDASTQADQTGISGPPSTIPAVVPGDGWAYAMAAEPMGVAGSPGLEPSGPFALPPLLFRRQILLTKYGCDPFELYRTF